ncbi:4'-phosphopantetheinyl transferase superfamily protein [Streptomyces sp. NPDC047000]|uniref:4'-phosphopantetheinyl transferase family protein n=1 Tax=Streptomyces sp. NPDC047000 TaxID=3155474 RepID=UPI00340051DB
MSGAAAGVTVFVAEVTGRAREAAHALLLRAAAAELAVPAGDLAVDHEPGGRPRLAGAPAPLHVSISHARDALVAVALSRHCPVGVDVETTPVRPVGQLARRWLAPAEAAWVTGLPASEQPGGFCHLWVQKEAACKALGTGLRRGGTRRPVTLPERWPTGEEPLRHRPDGRLPAGAELTLRALPGRTDLAVTACVLDAPPAGRLAVAAWSAVRPVVRVYCVGAVPLIVDTDFPRGAHAARPAVESPA